MIRRFFAAAASLAAFATPALAHTGLEPHAHGFALGFMHPLSGLDHLLAMAAVGLWAGVVGGKARWAWPAAFLAVMAAAAAFGSAGASIPFMEAGVALSIAVLGLAIAFGVRAPLAVGGALCGALAVFHGQAHGAEMPMDAAGAAYGAGFLCATAALHGAGLLAAGLLARASTLTVRVAGAGLLAASAALLVG